MHDNVGFRASERLSAYKLRWPWLAERLAEGSTWGSPGSIWDPPSGPPYRVLWRLSRRCIIKRGGGVMSGFVWVSAEAHTSYDGHGSLSGWRRSALQRVPPEDHLDPSGIHLSDLHIASCRPRWLGAEPSTSSTWLHGAAEWAPCTPTLRLHNPLQHNITELMLNWAEGPNNLFHSYYHYPCKTTCWIKHIQCMILVGATLKWMLESTM